MRSPRPSASVGSVNVIPLQLRENEIEVACQALSCSMHMLVVRSPFLVIFLAITLDNWHRQPKAFEPLELFF